MNDDTQNNSFSVGGNYILQRKIDPENYIDGKEPDPKYIFGREGHNTSSSKILLLLSKLEKKMIEDGKQGIFGSDIFHNKNTPAGYTYFGQILAHDLIFTGASPTSKHWDYERAAATPLLDLDCIYKGGPSRSPHLYNNEYSEELSKNRCRFRLGLTQPDRAGHADNSIFNSEKPQELDIPQITSTTSCNLSYDEDKHVEPLIGDPRNDENRIVSQISILFYRFHNKIVSILESSSDNGNYSTLQKFEIARQLTVRSYQNIIRYDYLYKILDYDTWKNVFGSYHIIEHPALARRLDQDSSAPLPVEFWLAAFRFGHHSINNEYNFNRLRSAENVKSILKHRFPGTIRDGKKHTGITNSWLIDMNLFFDCGQHSSRNGDKFNHSRLIRPALLEELTKINLPARRHSALFNSKDYLRDAGLTFLDLARGYLMSLPTAQGVAKLLDVDLMSNQQLEGDSNNKHRGGLKYSFGTETHHLNEDDIAYLKGNTPLLYYILREAEIQQDGTSLGTLGSAIVSMVFASSLKRYKEADREFISQVKNTVFTRERPLPRTMGQLVEFVEHDNPYRNARPSAQTSTDF